MTLLLAVDETDVGSHQAGSTDSHALSTPLLSIAGAPSSSASTSSNATQQLLPSTSNDTDPLRLRISPNNNNTAASSLTHPLLFLFGLNGVTLTLPMTATLYVLNIRVGMPLSWMPTYAAVAFLPCSFQPAYAWMSGSAVLPRHVQLWILLVCAGVTSVGTMFVPSRGGVGVCMALAFLQSLCTAWPEFLLGLTLLDEAEQGNRNGYRGSTFRSSSNERAATFQAQAATARSTGSVVAHVAVLVGYYSCSRTMIPTTAMNDTTIAILFGATGACYVLGGCIAWYCRVGTGRSSTSSGSSDDPHTSDTAITDGAIDLLLSQRLSSSSTVVDITTSRLDQECSLPFNLMSEEHRFPEAADTATDGDLLHNSSSAVATTLDQQTLPLDWTAEEQRSVEAAGSVPTTENEGRLPHASRWISFFLVVLLQASSILCVVRQPVEEATSHSVWLCMISVLALLLILVGCRACQSAKGLQMHHRVGLFLVLKHAVPSITLLMSSFLYTTFEHAPVFVQFLSLLDMGVQTFACVVYRKYFSRFSHPDQLVRLIAGMTLLAAAVSLCNIPLIRLLSDETREKHSWSEKVWLTIAAKALIGVTGEWRFLPDIVLATVSANMDDDTATSPESSMESKRQCNGLVYGSLVSCIDFGGQLGALLGSPLVALVGSTRDNGWKHLDMLQEISSVMILLSVVPLLLLVVSKR